MWSPCVKTRSPIIPSGCLEIRGGSFYPSQGTLSWCFEQSIRWSLVFLAPEIPLHCQLWYQNQSKQSVSSRSSAGSSSEFFEPVRKSKIKPTKNIAQLRRYSKKSSARSGHEINDEQWIQVGDFSFPVIARLLYYYYLLLEKCLSVKLSYLCVFYPIAYDQNSYRQ